MSENKPNFYAILPANVRYNKELSSTAKLLYAEITALCNDKGYCWATNQYFVDLYDVSDRQIRNILKSLVDNNLVKIIITKNKFRHIFIIDPEKNFLVTRKKTSGVAEENFLHNNIINNKKEYKEGEYKELFDYDWLNEKE